MTTPRDIETVVHSARTFAIDLGERVFYAGLYGFGAALIPTQATDASMWWAAVGAGTFAAVEVLRGTLAKFRGNKFSASLSTRV